MEKDDTTKHLLHIVTNLLVISPKRLIHLRMRGMNFLLFPRTSTLHKSFASNILNESLIMFLVLRKEFLRQSLNIKRIFDVFQFNLSLFIQEFLKIVCHGTARLIWSQHKGESFLISLLVIASLTTKRESPIPIISVFIMENHKGTGISRHNATDELLDTHSVACHQDMARHRDIKDSNGVEI